MNKQTKNNGGKGKGKTKTSFIYVPRQATTKTSFIYVPQQATTTLKKNETWSPVMDGINTELFCSANADNINSSAIVTKNGKTLKEKLMEIDDAYISNILYYTPIRKSRRWPVFERICKEQR